MDTKRKWELREANVKAWSGHNDVFQTNASLDSSLKKNTAFIKRLRTAITAASTPTFLSEVRVLSLHKYLSEVTSASYEGLCRLKTPVEVAAGVEIVSALHQRFGPDHYTRILGWHIGKGLSTPDRAQIKLLGSDAKEKEERERVARQRVLLRVLTELWLVGVLRGLDDISRPEEATTMVKLKDHAGQEKSKLGEAVSKKSGNKLNQSADTDPYPLEVLKDLLGHDREHIHLPLVVMFVKSFAWDVLGKETSPSGNHRKSQSHDSATPEATLHLEGYSDETAEQEKQETNATVLTNEIRLLTSPELQERFRNVIKRYFDNLKSRIVRDNLAIQGQSKRNAEAYVKSGEIFEDRQSNFEKQIKLQDKLIASAQTIAEILSLEMPDLAEELEGTGPVGPGIGLFNAGEYLRDNAEGAGIWEDEEERRFYEKIVDLRDRVPQILLEDAKKKKADDEPVGKRAEEAAPTITEDEILKTDAEEDLPAVPPKSVGTQVDALLARLPGLQNKDQVDSLATDFCFLNSKASRNRLVKTLTDVPKGRSDLFPLYARLVATLGKHLPDVATGLVSYLDDEFRSLQRRKQKDFLGSVRLGNVQYLAELTKFGVVPEHVIFHCLKVSLDNMSRINVEIIANLLETCGRYLLRTSETSPRMASFLETLQRKKSAQPLGQQEKLLIENAVCYVNPPERAAIERKEKSPLEAFTHQLIYLELNKRSYPKVLKSLRKLHWEESDVLKMLSKIFYKPWKVKYSNIYLLAVLMGSLYRFHSEFVIKVVDELLESIVLGLEQNEFKKNQKRVAEIRYLGELYNFKLVDSAVIFNTLYRIVSLGHDGGTPDPEKLNPLDLPDDFFRIRLVCTMLESCGVCFDRGASRKKLDFFLTFFQFYIHTKAALPMDTEFMVEEAFVLVRPQWKIVTSLAEAGEIFAELVKQNYKAQESNPSTEVEDVEELLSDGEVDGEDDEILIRNMNDVQSSDEEINQDEASLVENEPREDSDFDEEIVVTRQSVERDPEEEAAFDRELQKMMSEGLEARKFDRKQLFDVPLPIRRAGTGARVRANDTEGGGAEPDVFAQSQSGGSEQEIVTKQRQTLQRAAEGRNPSANGASTMAFSLMTKKGSKQQTKTIEMPSDSHIAIAMKNQQEAERLEQQQIKNHILNLDLQEHEGGGVGSTIYGNGNVSRRPSENSGLYGSRTTSTSQTPSRALSSNAAKFVEKSSTTKRGERARKLQLSDVDWT